MTNEKVSHHIIGYVNDSKRAVGSADMVKSLKLIDTNPLVTAEFLKKAQ